MPTFPKPRFDISKRFGFFFFSYQSNPVATLLDASRQYEQYVQGYSDDELPREYTYGRQALSVFARLVCDMSAIDLRYTYLSGFVYLYAPECPSVLCQLDIRDGNYYGVFEDSTTGKCVSRRSKHMDVVAKKIAKGICLPSTRDFINASISGTPARITANSDVHEARGCLSRAKLYFGNQDAVFSEFLRLRSIGVPLCAEITEKLEEIDTLQYLIRENLRRFKYVYLYECDGLTKFHMTAPLPDEFTGYTVKYTPGSFTWDAYGSSDHMPEDVVAKIATLQIVDEGSDIRGVGIRLDRSSYLVEVQ